MMLFSDLKKSLEQTQRKEASCVRRQNSQETVHFARHEIKNGLLEAIGILDSFRETFNASSSNAIPTNSSPQQQQLLLEDLDSTLKEVLETVHENAMKHEVVYQENYGAKREAVDVPSLLKQHLKRRPSCGTMPSIAEAHGTSRFPVFALENFPQLLLDPRLVRAIHKNAICNANKYGKAEGTVETHLSYDKASSIFTMKVKNLPGYNHAALMRLTAAQTQSVFEPHTQLALNQRSDQFESFTRRTGDGAWLMQKCAKSLGGRCSIQFDDSGTTMTFSCPAKTVPQWQATRDCRSADSSPTSTKKTKKDNTPRIRHHRLERDDSCTAGFKLPENTWAIAVEDSAIQRKLLGRFLQTEGGVSNDRCIILGQTAEEILDFIDTTKNLMKQHQPDHFLVIVDENLDIVEGGAVSKTISGSVLAQKLRESLDDDSRLLSLVRSANDSDEETQLYQSRAHAFLSKGPLRTGKNLLDEIKPWWKRRFHSQSMPDLMKKSSEKDSQPHAESCMDDTCSCSTSTTTRSSCTSSLSGVSNHSNSYSYGNDTIPSPTNLGRTTTTSSSSSSHDTVSRQGVSKAATKTVSLFAICTTGNVKADTDTDTTATATTNADSPSWNPLSSPTAA